MGVTVLVTPVGCMLLLIGLLLSVGCLFRLALAAREHLRVMPARNSALEELAD